MYIMKYTQENGNRIIVFVCFFISFMVCVDGGLYYTRTRRQRLYMYTFFEDSEMFPI
jgi:hypothetical protein